MSGGKKSSNADIIQAIDGPTSQLPKKNKKLYIVGEVVPSPKHTPQVPKEEFGPAALGATQSLAGAPCDSAGSNEGGEDTAVAGGFQ